MCGEQHADVHSINASACLICVRQANGHRSADLLRGGPLFAVVKPSDHIFRLQTSVKFELNRSAASGVYIAGQRGVARVVALILIARSNFPRCES